MNNFDNLDDLLKKKLDGMEFPFNEENWQKASGMMDAARSGAKQTAKKTLLFAGLISAGLIVISLTTYILTKTPAQSFSQNELAIKSNDEAIHTSEQWTDNTNREDAKLVVVKSNETTEKTTLKSGQNQTLANQNKANEKITAPDLKSQKNNLESKKAVSVKKVLAEKTIPSSGGRKSEGKTVKQSSQEKIPFNEANSNASLNAIGAIENAKLKHSTNIESDIQMQAENNPLIKSNTVVSEVQVMDDNNTATLTIASINAPAQPDTSIHPSVKKDYVRTKQHEIQIEAGALNSFGWKVNQTRNGNSLSPIAGVNYLYHFNKKSAMLIGAQYNAISNLNQSNISFSITSYNFGMKSDVTTFKFTELQYIVMPVKYIHTLSKNDQLGFGVNATYLFNIKNIIETYKVIDSDVNSLTSKNDTGYGFELANIFNAQLALSYSHAFTKKMAIHAEVNKNVMNIFKNYSQLSQASARNQPAALKLSLTYTLLHK